MTAAGWIEIALFVAILTGLTPLLGRYLAWVYQRPHSQPQQDWKRYARSVLVSSAVFWVLLYVLLRLDDMAWDVSFNTATSFVTNTNWQFYAGETELTPFTQMAGLTVQNFVSAAAGISVAIALIRGLAARSGSALGNYYVDLLRSIVFVLLPVSVVSGLFLVTQGVPQSLDLPVASQEAIKLLGTNGGGFFNVNSAHPFENPTWLSNFVEMLLILAIPAALTATYGRMVGNRRQGWTIFGAMLALFLVAVTVVYVAETGPTPAMHAAGITGINLEGKEQRFGAASTALFVVVTTAASSGAVNAAMESLSAIGGLVPLAQMQTGEVVFGGVGSGLYSMLLFAILGVFLSGLMVGRTPELLGKKIEAREIRLTVLGTIGVPLVVLLTTALAIATDLGRASIDNSGPQGFSETLYAYTSQANNNGSAFAGYGGVTFASLLGGLAMVAGRFLPMLVVLAIAGSLAGKRVAPLSAGTFRTDGATFGGVLVGVVVLVALLTFVPALLLGPVVQGMTHELF
jgi:K+-transporting ATPase ATPase A chain